MSYEGRFNPILTMHEQEEKRMKEEAESNAQFYQSILDADDRHINQIVGAFDRLANSISNITTQASKQKNPIVINLIVNDSKDAEAITKTIEDLIE